MVKLYIDTREYDISNYIDESSVVYSDNIDETRAHGGLTIPFIKQNALGVLDMSKPLPRLTPFIIEIDDEITYWKLSEDKVDKVRKGDNPLYSHEITLIEPTVDLENRPMPDMTVTQPKGVVDNYIYTVNQITGETTIIDTLDENPISTSGYETTGVLVNETLSTLSFDYGISNDITVIDENELLEVRKYLIQLNYEVYNVQYNYSSPQAEIEITVYADGTLIETFTTSLQSASTGWKLFTGTFVKPYIKLINKSFEYTPSGVGEVITIKARTTGIYAEILTTTYYDELWITKMGFNILTYEEGTTSKIMLDEVVDKILLIQKSAPLSEPTQEFTLADSTRSRIENIPSPEFKFSGYTMFDCLNEVASYVGAIVYLGEDDFTTIYFHFYDDVGVEGDIDYLEEQQNVYLQDYITGLEINAQNVINEDNVRYVMVEPSATGWLTIRTSDIGEITDANSTLQTTRPFYKGNKLLVKGLAFEMLDSSDTPVTFASTLEWDISNFLVEQTKWNGLSNQALDTRSGVLNKGNSLYYTQGVKGIFNLGYNDVILAPAWDTELPANYAIIEAILCQAVVENPTYHYANDYKPTVSLFDLKFRAYYLPFTNARVTVYRDDAATLNESVKYFNEQSSINDMKSLGDIAKSHANRKGNIVSSYRGIATNIYNLIKLGMKNDRGEILTAYEIAVSPKLREFVLHYSKDNPNISAYKGIPSAYRQWEIPNTDLVYRKDKYSEFVYLSEDNNESIYSIYATNQILANFQPTPNGDKLTYAVIELDYTGAGYTETVEATVDTLAFGNTTAIQIEMQDNYSAGFKQVEDTSAGIIRQDATQYGDEFGNIENVKITLFVTNAISDSNEYPDNNTTTTTGYESQLEIAVKKDAREIWGITQELVFRSNYINVRVYSGMAKFNGIVAEGSTVETVPFLLKKGYFPINENIDFTKLIQTTWDSTITDNELYTEFDVPSGEYEGYIWMEITTNTPIFSVKTTAFDTLTTDTLGHSVFYNISYARMISNYITDLEDELPITDDIDVETFVYPILDYAILLEITDDMTVYKSTNYTMTFEDTLTLNTSMVETDFTYPIVDLNNVLEISDELTSYKSTNFVISLEDTMALNTSLSSYPETNEYYVNLVSTVTLSDNITVVKSTNFIITVTDNLSISSTISQDKAETIEYEIDIEDSLSISSVISVVKSTNYIISTISDSLSLSSDISSEQTVTQWTYIGTSGTYDKSVSYVASGSTCVLERVVDGWVTTNYPPTDYAYGYVIRVLRQNEDLVPCTPAAYYYEAS